MKIFLSYIVLSVLLISCGGAKKGDSSNVANSSSALSCSIQEKPDIPASCTAQADALKSEENKALAQVEKDARNAGLAGVSMEAAKEQVRRKYEPLITAVIQTCYQNAGSPTKKTQICSEVSTSASDNLPIIANFKSSVQCLSGRSRLISNANFYLDGSFNGAIQGEWKAGSLSGNVLKTYVGVSAFRDLIFVSKISNGDQVIGYNVSLSFCEVPNAYVNYPALVSNERSLANFQAPYGIFLNDQNSCSHGFIASAQNTVITSLKKASDLYTNDYPIYTSFASPSGCLSSSSAPMYGYIYLKQGEPEMSTLEVRINGEVVPQNGWEYIGIQFLSSLDSSLKIIDLPTNVNSGYFIRLNSAYQFDSAISKSVSVYYTSKNK